MNFWQWSRKQVADLSSCRKQKCYNYYGMDNKVETYKFSRDRVNENEIEIKQINR